MHSFGLSLKCLKGNGHIYKLNLYKCTLSLEDILIDSTQIKMFIPYELVVNLLPRLSIREIS